VDILIVEGKRARAIKLLRSASTLDPNRWETFLQLGRLLGQEGKWKESEKAVEQALDLGAPKAECYRELGGIYRQLTEEASRACEHQERKPEQVF